MWMMGYSDGGEFNVPDSFNGRKLRPLIPRNPPLPPSPNNTSNSSPPTLSLLHGNEFFSLNHHLASMADQSKRDFHTQPVVVSSRWNPTPEQLRTLEELYRRGTRTPSAEQIQHITAQLRRYGKIEGKNVFYWFQNHKARERQKRRRQMESTAPDHHHEQQQNREIEIYGKKESGTNRTVYEGEQTKNWAPSTNCSALPEETMSMEIRAAKGIVTECKGEEWNQFDEVELQRRRSFMERNATWQMMQLSSTYLINTSCSSTTTTRSRILAEAEAEATASTPTVLAAGGTIRRSMDPNKQQLIKTHNDLNIFIAPYRENSIGHGLINHFISNEEDHNGCGDSHQTLQLFPLCSSGGGESINDKETENSSASAAAAMNANFTTPHQFFEFLPLKN